MPKDAGISVKLIQSVTGIFSVIFGIGVIYLGRIVNVSPQDSYPTGFKFVMNILRSVPYGWVIAGLLMIAVGLFLIKETVKGRNLVDLQK